MSDQFPRNDSFPDDAFEDDGFDLEEEAVPEIATNEEGYDPYDDSDWEDAEIDPLVSDDFEEETVEYNEDANVSASFYEPPEPPLSDDELTHAEGIESDGNWFKDNWWRLAIVAVLVALIIFLLARSCGGAKSKPMPTMMPSPTHVLLPTFTPTPQTVLLPTTELNTGAQATPASNGETVSVTVAPAPTSVAPATGGKFTINQVVIVTGTGKDKLSFRAGPGKNYARLSVIGDGTELTIIGGPEQGDGLTWWRLKTKKGLVGWAVEDYLKPTQ